ncbi:MAG: hypothetical protein R3A52_22615 [Polyangiales bacterium]
MTFAAATLPTESAPLRTSPGRTVVASRAHSAQASTPTAPVAREVNTGGARRSKGGGGGITVTR